MRGTIIKAPERWNETVNPSRGVFLAGGITNCAEWQNDVANTIAENLPITVLNPRRENWNMKSSHVDSVVQIQWEAKYLKKCEDIIFWFPSTSDCPITLFELGACLGKGSNLIIGTDENYRRRLDVEVQVALVDPKKKIWSNLNSMIEHFIKNWH